MINLESIIEPKKEIDLHKIVLDLFKKVYPDIPVKGNYLSGVQLHSENKKTPYKLLNNIKKTSGDQYFPDLEILKPVGNYSGLFIELKKKSTDAFLKDGSFSNSKEGRRAALQSEYGEKLKKYGYWFEFGIGLKDTWEKIEEYLEGI